LVDGLFCDHSLVIAREFKKNNPDLPVKILNNPRGILASGWNLALKEASGDVLLRWMRTAGFR